MAGNFYVDKQITSACRVCGMNLSVLRKSYPRIKSKLAPKPVDNFLDLRTKVFPMLTALGPSLQHDLVLLNKVVRILKAALEQVSETISVGLSLKSLL